MSDKISGILVKKYLLDIKKEVFRKSIHLCTAFIPLLLKTAYLPTIILLFLALALYTISENLRLHGTQVPLISEITAAAARKRDENKFVLGPVTLVLGIITCAIFWKQIPASIGIYALAFGDGLASLVGKLVKSPIIPFTNHKTLAGSLACFLAIFLSTLFVLKNIYVAFIIALIGMFIEVLPLKDFDNLLIPIFLGGTTQILFLF